MFWGLLVSWVCIGLLFAVVLAWIRLFWVFSFLWFVGFVISVVCLTWLVLGVGVLFLVCIWGLARTVCWVLDLLLTVVIWYFGWCLGMVLLGLVISLF